MSADKKCFKTWGKITAENFKKELNQSDNGFAIITGDKYIMIDIDLKHSPPQEIYDCLYKNCKAVEKTPGGYHFWFLNDENTIHFKSKEAVYWNNKKIPGLDIRAKPGLGYCCPTHYVNTEGATVSYKWIKAHAMLSLLKYLIIFITQKNMK
jgi:hypothetical protein